jgi:hypothetical protein
VYTCLFIHSLTHTHTRAFHTLGNTKNKKKIRTAQVAVLGDTPTNIGQDEGEEKGDHKHTRTHTQPTASPFVCIDKNLSSVKKIAALNGYCSEGVHRFLCEEVCVCVYVYVCTSLWMCINIQHTRVFMTTHIHTHIYPHTCMH